MPELTFQVDNAEPIRHAATPQLALKLRIDNADPAEPIHNVLLQCQVRIEAPRRRYSDQDKARLVDLFGEPRRWGQTLRSMLWSHTSVIVQPFTGSTAADLPLPCTFDFNVAATKYLDALEDAEIPLALLFTGTVFYEGDAGVLQVARISWDKEADYRLPVRVWKEMMNHYYPNTAWLNLRKDVFDRLQQHKSRCALPTWEQALDSLLDAAEERLHDE